MGHRIKYGNTEVEILNNNYCLQHQYAAVLALLNHFYFESFSSHVIQVYKFAYIFINLAIFILFSLSTTVVFFLHFILNILRYEKIFCEIDESVASQHNPSSDAIFLGVHSESIFPFYGVFFFSRKLFFLWSPCLLLIAESVILDTSVKPTAEFFLKITSPSLIITSISLDELNSNNLTQLTDFSRADDEFS